MNHIKKDLQKYDKISITCDRWSQGTDNMTGFICLNGKQPCLGLYGNSKAETSDTL